MKTLTITESKAQLSALVKQVIQTGRPVTIGRSGTPMVQLVPYKSSGPANKRIGAFTGKIQIADDFDHWDESEASALGLKD